MKLVDENVLKLTDAHIQWADYVFVTAMIVQKKSLQRVIARCNALGVPVVAGGPYVTTYCDEIQGVAHLLLDEVEDYFPKFLRCLENGEAPYLSHPPIRDDGGYVKPSIFKTPLPRYDLIRMRDYAAMCLQFSRGCPFKCEWCDIIQLFGRVPRTKTPEQILAELDLLHKLGWRGTVFLVDDNFIANKKLAMELLERLIPWQEKRNFPFGFVTEASVNVVDIPNMLDFMARANFKMLFGGFETPNPKALEVMGKVQNVSTDPDRLLHAVQIIQAKGIKVTGGFMSGVDGEDEDCFRRQFKFIQEAGIPSANVGKTTAVRGTDFYRRLQKDGRLLNETPGDGVFEAALNFRTLLDREFILKGHRDLLNKLYDPTLRNYFERCRTMLKRLKPESHYHQEGMGGFGVIARVLFHFFIKLILSRRGPECIKFLIWVARRDFRLIPEAIRLAIMGYHFRKITQYFIKESS